MSNLNLPDPQSIDEILLELDKIIDECVANRSYQSIFACIYRRTTAEIKKGIQDGRFADKERMEKFDVRFARFYIDAYRNDQFNGPVSKSWALAFNAKNEQLTILQHLMMGMNAHINLDLGVTGGTIASGDKVQAIKADFMVVNDILEGLVNELQQRISRVSPMIFLLDWIGQNNDEKVADFSMRKSRDNAWNLACLLAPQDEKGRELTITGADELVATFGGVIQQPPGRLLRYVLNVVRWVEEKDPVKILDGLRG